MLEVIPKVKSFFAVYGRRHHIPPFVTGLDRIIVGMEPRGHYWKALAWFLKEQGLTVVLVNPYHVKQLKELDDNVQTKNDPKDAMVIAKLVKDGRFSYAYLPEGIYAELRVLSNYEGANKSEVK